jgi:hypothetical protein
VTTAIAPHLLRALASLLNPAEAGLHLVLMFPDGVDDLEAARRYARGAV